MNKFLLPIAALTCLISSCDSASPDDYFGRAVLNHNMSRGFAGKMMEGELRQPSMKLDDKGGKNFSPMSRKEVVDDKLEFAEDAYGKVKDLKVTDESREMIAASVAVYEYMLPVLRNEYTDLAKLYDDGAAQGEIDALSLKIRETYEAGYNERVATLQATGKAYSEAKGLDVKWGAGGR